MIAGIDPRKQETIVNKTFKCPLCGQSFGSQEALDRHMASAHGESKIPQYEPPPSQESLWQQVKKEVPVFPEFWKMTPEQNQEYIAAGFGLKQPLPQETAQPIFQAAISGQPVENYPVEWQAEIKRIREGFKEPTPAKEFTVEWALPSALLAGTPSALSLWRGAGALAKPAQIAAKTALAPFAGAEYAAGAALKYGVIIPITKGIPRGVEKLLQFALDQGLDKWIATEGRILPEFRGKIANWIIGNKNWLIEKATQNMLRRQAEAKGAQAVEKVAQSAADDTIKEAEPFLLKAGGVKAPAEILATNTQKVAAHRLAFSKGLIDKAGNMTPRYRQLAQSVTGKTTMTEMTQDEAATFVEALKSLGSKGGAETLATPPPGGFPTLPTGVTGVPTVTERLGLPDGLMFAETPAPISTAQIAQITQLATDKLLISEHGKLKPQFKNFLESYTGKRKIEDLTPPEAEAVISTLEKLPELGYRGGQKVPPTIPKTTEVVPENFFKLKFKRPTPIKYFTSQTYYAEQLGVKPLVEPLEIARQEFDLERVALNRAIDSKGIEIDKLAGTTLGERTAAKVKNVPTKAIERMRDALDKYEEPPADFSVEEAKLFNWFRNLNKTMLDGENEVRQLLGMEKIPYRKAYVRHVADGLAYEILAGKYPLPEGLKYWASEIVSKKVFNPTERARKLADDLEGYFTKDLIYATKSMVYSGLKEIHLSQPLHAFTKQLAGLSKDLPVYKNLSAQEIAALRGIDVMPASTKKWVIDYVNQVIKGQPTGLDEAVNRMLINRGLAAVINAFLKPFGRSLGTMPITKITVAQGRLTIAGAMGWRPKQLIRNKFQWMQDLALYSIKANLKGSLPTPKGSVLEELLNKSLFLKGYTGMEELPVGIQGKLEKAWLAPFQWTAITNASTAMKKAFYDIEELIVKPKFKQYEWADPQRTFIEPKGFFYPSEKDKLLKEMEFGAGCTQYQYIGMAMPEVFRNKVLTPVTRLQSWWMNYFFKFHREAITRAFTGKTSYGAKLPWSRRLGWFRYLILGGAVLVPMGYGSSYLAGVLPSRFAPVAQFATGMYQYVSSDTEWEKSKALRQMYDSWQVMIPGSLAFKDFKAVFSGEKDLKSLFFYATGESAIYQPEWEKEPTTTPTTPAPTGFPTQPPMDLKTAQKKIEDATWAQNPQLKTIYDQIKELEKTDPVAAKRLQLQHPEILNIRRQIAMQQAMLKRQQMLGR